MQAVDSSYYFYNNYYNTCHMRTWPPTMITEGMVTSLPPTLTTGIGIIADDPPSALDVSCGEI